MKKLYLLLFIVFFTACSTTKNQGDYYFIKGLNSYQKNDKVSALSYYKKAYEKNKDNTLVLKELAYLYADLGNISEAEKYYKKVLEIEPNNTNALQNLLKIYYEQKDALKMKTYMSNILDKNSYLYKFSEMRVLEIEKNYTEAYKIFGELITDVENRDLIMQEDFYKLAEKINKNYPNGDKNADAYEKYLSLIYEKYQDDENYIKNYSRYLFNNKRYEETEKILMNYILNHNDSIEMLSFLAELFHKQNKLSKEKAVLEMIKNKNK